MADREFKGVWIPREVWLDERLNALDKIILAEIDSLDNSEDHCHAGNEYLAGFCQCSESKVTKTISKLIELGYIKVHSFDGRIRRLRSCMVFTTGQSSKKYDSEPEIIPPINITNNKKNNSISRKRAQSEESPGFAEFWKQYPRKVAKQNAVKAWIKTGADDSQALTDTIIADVKRRVNGEWDGKDIQYVPHPATYLNQRRWEDEAEEKVEQDDHDLSLDEIMRRAEDTSVPEGFTPCGGW